MAFLDPQQASEHFQTRVADALKTQFPIKGRRYTIDLRNVEVKDNLHSDDLRTQHAAKVSGGDWTVPLSGEFTLTDNQTGEVLQTKKMRVANVPKMTKRYSYILGGQEYQVDNQWQLKPGVYVRRNRKNEVVAQVNALDCNAFSLQFDPAKKVFSMQYNKANIPLYPLLKSMGVGDAELEQAWGKEVLKANQSARGVSSALDKFYQTDRGGSPPAGTDLSKHFNTVMGAARIRPDATQHTLGKPFDTISGEVLSRATGRMLAVQAGQPEDDRDSLTLKDLRSVGDFTFDKIHGASRDIRNKVRRQLDRAGAVPDLRDVLKTDVFDRPIRKTFHENAAARTATQINPVEMVSSAFQTTVMGTGGIQSERQVVDETKFVNPSHLGFLDPVITPEGSKTGVSLRLPVGVTKSGMTPEIPLFNIKTGKTERVTPGRFADLRVALPDQVTWKGGKPHPVGASVKVVAPGGEIVESKFGEVTHIIPHQSQLFSLTTNLIPFLGNTSGNRASMAGRHLEQAISLRGREAPLVQVATGMKDASFDTFEKVLGQTAAHFSPVAGTVTSVGKDAIHIKGADGKSHEVQIYHNYPLNDSKSVLTSTPVVKAGDRVQPHQVIADTNFSKNGALALGTNLRVAYLPYKGYNFEDGVVISETAAKKLSSEHLHKYDLANADKYVLNKSRFALQHLGTFKKDQLSKLDDTGVVRVGQKVTPGDPLIAALKPLEIKASKDVGRIGRVLSNFHSDASLRWDSDHEGEVVAVHRTPKGVTVHVRTLEPMQVGDKISARFGNKGIVSMILSDKEMPHTKDGKPIEVALNPSGVPGRMNPGQLLETAASKIALKTGKPFVVHNFQPQTDMLAQVQQALKTHGLSDTEELHDPITGKSLGKVMVGHQHMVKLVHQVDKKTSVRSGMTLPKQDPEQYDLNLQPVGGSGAGGQSIGALGMYALLANGATANLREMQTWKSEGRDPQTDPTKRWNSQHAQVWEAIQLGHALPTPKSTFAFQKFTDLLRGSGINVEKQGNQLALSPLTDKHILDMATEGSGDGRKVRFLPKPTELLTANKLDESGNLKPIPGGLFDEKLTGGHGGFKWSAIKLAEPVPNPVFEGPIRKITGLTGEEFTSIVHGVKAVNANGAIVDLGHGVTGGAGIKMLLDRIDVQKELAKAKQELSRVPAAKVDPLLKKVRYLRALDQLGLKPSDAYILHHVPVLPPVMRPASLLPTGDVKWADVNDLYKGLGEINHQLHNPVPVREVQQKLRRDLYGAVQAIAGLGTKYEDAENKGLLHQIAGSSPKEGFFQKTLLNKRQDLSMRSTIVPEPALGLDEVGLPRQHALKLFSPFVVKKIMEYGYAPTQAQAQELLSQTLRGETKNQGAWKALDKVVEERPVLLKRDPALHKYSVQGFNVKLTDGHAIQIHPLVVGGFNADFDGDTMSVYVPIHRDAVAEARNMMPSKNLLSDATGKVMYQPTLESALGLFKLTMPGKDTNQKFADTQSLIAAAKKGTVGMHDVVHINGKPSTPGRAMLASVLPSSLQGQVLHDMSFRMDKKGLNHVLEQLAQHHQGDFGKVVNNLKDLGNDTAFGVVRVPDATSKTPLQFHNQGGLAAATIPSGGAEFIPVGAHTLSLQDFIPDRVSRSKALSEAKATIDKLPAGLTPQEKERRTVQAYMDATDSMRKYHMETAEKNPDNLFLMHRAGVKPSWDQYKQMKLAPMLLRDSSNRTLPVPVTQSYAEGLDVAGYWTQMHGARRGSVMKVQEVREPGYMSKLLMNNTMHLMVAGNDCGTKDGISMHAASPDAVDRFLAKPVSIDSLTVPAGTRLSPDILGKIREAKKDATIVVRSPLKCEHSQGICQHCLGLSATGQLDPIGTNVGVRAAHAIGERAVQLTLKQFHSGGVIEQGGGKLLNDFSRFQLLTMLPKEVPNEAVLAMNGGKVDRVQADATGTKIFIGGKEHHIGKDVQGNALHQPLPGVKVDGWSPVQVGDHVHAGQPLSDPSRTIINPHTLYRATKSLEQVQNHLTNEITNLYKHEDVKRRHVEVVVKAMSNLTKIHDPGGHPTALRGEFQSLSNVNRMNRELVAQGKTPIKHEPVVQGIQMLPLSLQEDWMAKLQHQRLQGTLLEAAALGQTSNLRGAHPIPGAAYGADFGADNSPTRGHY